MSAQITVRKTVGSTPIKIEGAFTPDQLPLLRMILEELVRIAEGMEHVKTKRMMRRWRKKYRLIDVDKALQNVKYLFI